MGKLVLTYRDYGSVGERSTAIFEGVDMTAANFDAQTTLQNTLRDAVNGITLGELTRVARVAVESPQPGANPASPFAQRETKWLVRYHDSVTGKRYSLELPCADLALLSTSGDDVADMTDAAVIAFVNAFESYIITGDGNAPEVDELRFVGRNF
jgi:hypothetical protein